MNNDIEFNTIIIKQGSISDVSWLDDNYAEKLMNLDLFEIINTTNNNFMNIIENYLEINKYDENDNIKINTVNIGDEPNFFYEMLYIDFSKNIKYNNNDNENQLASLYNLDNEKIYSNVIIFKTHLPSLTDSLESCSITKKDLENILYNRVYTKIVIWDGDKWNEIRVKGDLIHYANIFFDGDNYEKTDLIFLNHNIYIWFTTSYGEKGICGKLINKTIDKCIIFTMKSEEYRGNITLDEVNKIIYLSNILDKYDTPEIFLKEKIDKLGRRIINTKYKVLDCIYHDNK